MIQKARKESQIREIWRNYKRNKTAMVGLFILLLLLFVVLFADLIVGYDISIAQDGANRLLPPGPGHIFGTDTYGRDVFARIVHGSRNSLIIGVVTTIVSVVVGGVLGSMAGYYGGKIDDVIMRIMDIMMCIPAILLALAVVAALGTSIPNLIIALSVPTIPSFARITRASLLSVSSQDFIEAAKAYGASDRRIVLKYIMPNAMGPIIVQATMGVSQIILSAAALSYIGMGVPAPAPEWGAMLSNAREYMQTASYLLYIPGISIVLSALAFNLAGDGLRDAMDPKLRR